MTTDEIVTQAAHHTDDSGLLLIRSALSRGSMVALVFTAAEEQAARNAGFAYASIVYVHRGHDQPSSALRCEIGVDLATPEGT